MKRRRKSTTQQNPDDEEEENGFKEVSAPSASITDLPSSILIDILSRLSVKSIFRCRCVSKIWLNLLLNPDFVKLHLTRAPTCPLLRKASERSLANALYLIELERDSIWDVCDKSCDIKECCGRKKCYRRKNHYIRCDRHVNMKLRTIFMLPELELESGTKTKIIERRFNVVNSCNGLLCLCGSLSGHPIVIYNPVTGEYSVLPRPEDDENAQVTVCGLGYCLKSNQYKVLVMIFKWISNPTGERFRSNVAVAYTLGLGPWRRTGNAPYFECGKSFPAFMNGALHWLVDDYEFSQRKIIVSFDFEVEQFRALPIPPPFLGYSKVDEMLNFEYPTRRARAYQISECIMSMGVLRDRLSICDFSPYNTPDLWVMKNYGVKESWFKAVMLKTLNNQRWPLGWYQPIDYLNNGDLLMYHERNAILLYEKYKLREQEYYSYKFKYKIRGTKLKFLSIAHVPSFVSLKEVMGDDAAVLNVRLPNNGVQRKKVERLRLVEENPEILASSDSSSSEGCYDD